MYDVRGSLLEKKRMSKRFCHIFFLLFIECGLFAQLTSDELFDHYKRQSDSVLLTFLSEDFIKAHLKMNKDYSGIQTDYRLDSSSYKSIDISTTQLVGLVVYDFYPDKIYGFPLIYVSVNAFNPPFVSNELLELLKSNASAKFISDKEIETIALKNFNLEPDNLVVEIYFDQPLHRPLDIVSQAKVLKQIKKKDRKRLLVKIGEPTTFERTGVHSQKSFWGKFVVVDAYSAEKLGSCGRRKEILGQYYWLGY